jgi:hypothetical protein
MRPAPPRVDLSMYPPTLRLKHYLEIFQISARTFRRQRAAGTLDVRPSLSRPVRWKKANVETHLNAIDLVTDRRRKAQRHAA